MYYDQGVSVAPNSYKLPDVQMPSINISGSLPNRAIIERKSSIGTVLNPDQLTGEYLSIGFGKYDHDLGDKQYGKFSMSTVGEKIDRIFLSGENTQLHLDFSGDFKYKIGSEKVGEENKGMEKKWSGVFFSGSEPFPGPTTKKIIGNQEWKLVTPNSFNETELLKVFDESLEIVRKAMGIVDINNNPDDSNSFIQIQETIIKFREDTLAAYQELKKES